MRLELKIKSSPGYFVEKLPSNYKDQAKHFEDTFRLGKGRLFIIVFQKPFSL